MCGIAGWFSYGAARPTPDIVKGLLLANLERGVSAAGVAWREGKKIRVRKSEGPADKFIAAQPKSFFEELADSPIGLLHARATTKGSEKKNENNHPVVGFDWVAVHNGTIVNDDDLWEYYEKKQKVERFAEVDTSTIPLLLTRGSKIEEGINHLSLLSGTATFAAWNGADINRVVIGRFGHHDLFMFWDEKAQIMYWSSAGSSSYVMPGPIIGRHKFMTYAKLADEHVMLLTPEGPSKTRVFKVERRPFFGPVKPKVSTSSGSVPKAAAFPLSKGTKTGTSGSPTARPEAVLEVKKGHRKMMQALVGVDNPLGERQINVVWQPIDETHERPWPMNTTFNAYWCNLGRWQNTLSQSKDATAEHSVGYGRWKLSKPDTAGEPMKLEFFPYKRTKEWMEKAYRTRFKLPFKLDEEDGKLYTEVDTHWAWEHYDLEIVLMDNSTRRILGFMCPWCGAWQSAIQVRNNNHRCEMCHAENRLVTGFEAA